MQVPEIFIVLVTGFGIRGLGVQGGQVLMDMQTQ